ncbi:MAG: cell envelope biogenesis protein LolA [Marinosulfonomonas sp.]|nr:MAG: cell envelope biogenesis protein LolA [Marinosulfonomonas sp.]
MKHIRLILAPLALLVLVAPAMAEILPLSVLSTYFNNIKTAEASFTQINDDGTISTGDMLIRRPGRIRFEYNPPDESLVMASGGQVAIFDPRSNQPPQRFPLSKTPLFLILAKNVNFDRADMVVGHTTDGISTTVIAQDPKRPEYGSIQLIFTGNPVQLRQWIVTDGSGQQTTVILGEFSFGRELGVRTFDIRNEMESRGF